MLRIFVLLLLLLNGGYYAWSQGLLAPYGFAPAQQGEPQHLAQQIRPEAMRLLSADELRRVEQSAQSPAKPAECLQAGLFDEAQTATVRRALEGALAAEAWRLEPVVVPARWIVYMGRYPSTEVLERKRKELASLNLKYETLQNAELEPGLSLGGFESQAKANEHLAALGRQGVRTARVVQERAEVRGSVLKLPAVDEALRPKLDELKPALAGKALQACK